ncbi:MAG: S-layer homology domain-containing protein [Clostridia bacterium]|nr:S-layer homology domain-containing protein [Clostridia bacterium]
MKRFISVLLLLVMLLSVLPMTAFAEAELVEVDTAEDFVAALKSNGDKNIIVTKNIIHTCTVADIGSYWITLGKGQKTLNLNGKKVELNAETGFETTMIRVPAGAELIIKDTSGDNSGTLFCYGKMESAYSEAMGLGMPEYFNSGVKHRNVLEIDGGMVTINGGTLEAGRSKKMWVMDGKDIYSLIHLVEYALQYGAVGYAVGSRFDGYAWQQVNGDCITVNDGTLMINDGVFLGRGFSTFKTYIVTNNTDVELDFVRSACLRLLGGNTIINNGTFHGKGNADVIDIENGAGITIKNATIKTNHLRVLLIPTINLSTYGTYNPYVIGHKQRYGYKYHPASDPGTTGLMAEMLDPARHTVEVNGEILPASEWSYRTLGSGWVVGNDYKADDTADIVITHHLSNSDRRNNTRSDGNAVVIDSAAILGTLALGVPLDSKTLELSAQNVRNMHVEWYHNGEAAEDDAVVHVGTYQAKITLTAENGYKFTEDSDFTVMGKAVKEKDIQISTNGKRAYILSDVYEFECGHHLNDDTSIRYDETGHYLQCTFCGEKYSEEEHIFIKSETDGNYIKYYCYGCDYYIEKADDGKIKIDAIDLRIVDPEVGKNPDYYIAISTGNGVYTTETSDEYTENGVKWTKAGTGWGVKKDDVFTGSMWYKAYIELQIDDGYSLARNEKDEYSARVYVNNCETKYDVDGNTITVYYEYITDDVVVSSIDINGIDWPEIGNTPDYTAESTIPEYYTAKQDYGAVTWYVDGEYMDRDAKFEVGKAYTVTCYVDSVRVGWDDVVKFNESLCATLDGFNVKTENIERISDTTVKLSFTFPILTNDITFKDVTGDKYYYSAVIWAAENGITNGTGDNKFSPDESCTRGQVVTFLWRAAGCPEPKGNANPFADVKESDWFYKPVLWAVEEGITGGTSLTTFSPNQTCSSAHIVTFLYRAAKIGKDGWYEVARDWAIAENLTRDTGLTVSPDETCPRGAVVTFLYRFMNK